MKIKAFITHKQAELFADCQDRFGVNPDTKSIAVSDGMGSTWQQKIWAQLLVDTYIDSTDWCPSRETIKPLCQTWRNRVADFIQNLRDTSAPINIIYRSERNFVEGRSAGATFVGIRFNGDEWNGSVLGDSCLIEWDGKLAKFYTSQNVEKFDSYPDYFDSDPSKEGKGVPLPISGILTKGTVIFLVSDPFSGFLFEHRNRDDIAHYIQQLLSLSSHDDFEALVCEWRKEGMQNDDTTLVIVENDDSENLTITYADNIAEIVENEKLSQNYASHVKQKIIIPQGGSLQGEEQDSVNFVVVQDSVDFFISDYLTEFQRYLQKKYPKQMGKLKNKWVQKAAEEVLHSLFEKYSIIKK